MGLNNTRNVLYIKNGLHNALLYLPLGVLPKQAALIKSQRFLKESKKRKRKNAWHVNVILSVIFNQSETLQKPSGRSVCAPQKPEVVFSAL